MKVNLTNVIEFIKVKNFVTSVLFGMGNQGVERLVDDLKRLSASDMLSIIKRRKGISNSTYVQAKKLFLASDNNLSKMTIADQKEIVHAIGFHALCHLYSEKYFDDTQAANDAVMNIFRISNSDERYLQAQGLFKYYGEGEGKDYRDDAREIMNFLAGYLLEKKESCRSFVPKEFVEYIVDTRGIYQAYERQDSDIATVLDYASEQGIREFYQNCMNNSIVMVDLQTTLLVKGKKTLLTIVDTVGCATPNIERHLLIKGVLPAGSVSKNFCFAENFSLFMDTVAAKADSLVPDFLMKTMPKVAEWVLNNRTVDTSIKREDYMVTEWNYLLADDKLLGQYIASGGELTEGDIKTMLKYGKDNMIIKYQSR